MIDLFTDYNAIFFEDLQERMLGLDIYFLVGRQNKVDSTSKLISKHIVYNQMVLIAGRREPAMTCFAKGLNNV